MTKFAERLRLLREQHGLTRKELAKLLGYSEITIQRWEIKATIPRSKYIIKICQYFNVTCDYLLGISDKK